MISQKVRVIGLCVIAAFTLYVLLGFFAVPPLIKQVLRAQFEERFKHQLSLGEVKFNPLTLSLELNEFDLREPSGGALVTFRRLFVNFQASSLFRRAWSFAEVSVDGPALNGELRADGSHNFSVLLAAMRDPEPKPDAGLPRLVIDRIAISDGRVDLADRQAGEAARLRLAPINFELTDLSTLPEGKSPYKLTARSADGELLQWGGEVSLNPVTSSGKLALSKWRVATLARLLGDRISLAAASGEIDLSLSYRTSYADGNAELAIADMTFELSGLQLTPEGAAEPLAAIASLELSGVSLDLGTRSIAVERAALDKARLILDVDADGRGNWRALLPAVPQQRPASATTPATASAGMEAGPPPATTTTSPPSTTAATSPAPTPTEPSTAAAAAETSTASATTPTPAWRLKLAALAASNVGLKLSDKRAATRADLSIEGAGLNFAAEIEHAADATRAALEGFKLTIAASSAAADAQALTTKDIAIASGAFTARHAAAGTEIDVADLKATLAGLGLRQASDELRIQKLDIANQAFKATLPADAAHAPRLILNGLSLDSAGMAGKLAAAKAEVLELRSLSASTKSLVLVPAADRADVDVDGLAAKLAGLALRDPADGTELARLGSAEAQGGTLSLGKRQASVERVMAVDGHAAAVMRVDGKLNWDALLAALGRVGDKPGTTPAKAAAGTGSADWKAVAKTIELRNFGASIIVDERQRPAIALGLHDVNLRARNAGTDRASPAQIELAGRIKDGGQFSASGQVNLQTLASDLKLKLTELSLVPAQPLLAQYLRLQLQSALASAEGRLRYNQEKSAGANLLFEGELGLAKVVIDETEPNQPFLSLDALQASEVRFALAPDRLEIPELRLSGLATRLVITADQSVSVVKLLRQRAEPTKVKPAAASAPTSGAVAAAPDFPVSISRIRFDHTRLDFADLSLRPQFSARMHELQGVITGASTARDSRAQLELEARVDEYGSARIRGEMSPFQPRVYTNVDMIFRNLEMTTLSPYSAKFAGYNIASGRLSVDLQYRIKDSALQGEHKIVLDKLELGERVESPGALNLPLELAIAILKDSDGRIDIGLPVSGSLDDPQFSYGQVIWRAIGNLLTRIVTAPFRALASLFGGSTENLGTIEFDAGADRLLPPERQKLKTVAEALQKRPQLRLTVKPAYAANADRPAMQSLAARRAIWERAGVKLQPGEAPGPLDYDNTRVQQAIQALFEEKFGAPASRDLKAALDKATSTPPGEAGKPAAKPQPAAPATVARTMAERLVGSFAIDEAALAELAKRRGEAVTQELREAGKVDPVRLATAAPQATDAGSGSKIVATELDLGVMK